MIEFHCPDHGFCAETFVSCLVICKCRKRCLRFLAGRRLSRDDVYRLTKNKRR